MDNRKSMDIEKIVLKAAFFEERRGGGAYRAAATGCSEERLKEWEQLLNVAEDNSIFSKRLQHDGISREEALDICGESISSTTLELPRWAEILQESAGLLPVTTEEVEGGTTLNRAEIKLTGPVVSLFPFVMYCESRWKEFAGELFDGQYTADSSDLPPMKDLSMMILDRLYQAAYQVFNTKARFMTLMGNKAEDGLWEKIEKELLSGGWQELFEEYPVLARRMGTAMEQYLDFIEEFFLRFREKKETLEKEFFQGEQIGRIVKMEGEISDLHQDGRCVLVLTFDNNRKLVYKPRTLEIDVNWERFVKNFPPAEKVIQAPHAIDFGEYGFVDYIQHEPCGSMEEIKTYFYNAGALMALLYAFSGNDFHRENIIASGTYPVIIDTETLMIPVARPFEQGGQDVPSAKSKESGIQTAVEQSKPRSLSEMMEASVTNLGMLPVIKLDERKAREDLGGLTGDSEGWDNLPVFDGKKFSAVHFQKQVTEGFRQMYLKILENRRELLEGKNGIRLFTGCKFRMLIRTSQVYANVIKHINRSVTLKDGFDYSIQTERMAKAFLYTAKEEIISGLLQVFKSEKYALENGNIPIFYGEPGGEGILDDKQLLYQNYFSRSPLEKAEECIRNMDEADLEIQLQIIEKNLTAETGDVHTQAEKADPFIKTEHKDVATDFITEEELIQKAEAIFGELMEDRIKAPNGDYSWLTGQYDVKSGGSSMSLMGYSLYDGLLGVAVFAGALYRLTEKTIYKNTADYCIQKTSEGLEALLPVMERYQAPLGYGSGVGGFVAGLAATAEYTGNQNAVEAVEKLLLGISEKSVYNDKLLDVLGGCSGLVIALTSWKGLSRENGQSEKIKQILEWCGRHLLETRTEQTKEGYRVWAGIEASQALTGLGHGAAGIALALMRIYQTIGGAEYLEAAKEAVAYENAVFEQNQGNWPDFRIGKQEDKHELKFMSGYCAGAPGIGLSRLGMLAAAAEDAAFNEALQRDIKRTDRFVREFSTERRDHLCCGRTGGIDFLMEEALTLGDEEAMSLAKARMKDLIDEQKQNGRYSLLRSDGKFLTNPTLFQGTAGIGYEMLRLAAPGTIRSILI